MPARRDLAAFLLQMPAAAPFTPPSLESPTLRARDIQMPEFDGQEAARRVKSSPGGDCLPIVAVTSHASSGDRDRPMAPGFSARMEKPMATEPFVSQIAQYPSGASGTP